jgi:hypothetical protein
MRSFICPMKLFQFVSDIVLSFRKIWLVCGDGYQPAANMR